MLNYIKEFKWFLIIFVMVAGWMIWNDLQGNIVFLSNKQEKWSAAGVKGYHK